MGFGQRRIGAGCGEKVFHVIFKGDRGVFRHC